MTMCTASRAACTSARMTGNDDMNGGAGDHGTSHTTSVDCLAGDHQGNIVRGAVKQMKLYGFVNLITMQLFNVGDRVHITKGQNAERTGG